MVQQGRVVVGVDGSPASVEAVRRAERHANQTDATVEAVLAWENPVSYGGFPLAAERDWEVRARRTLDATLQQALGSGAGSVTRRVVQGNPARVLREQAAGADLLVLPRAERRGLRRLGLGAAAHALVTHTSCPVLVVRRAAGGPVAA